jgi:hypothetical protein
MVSFPRLASCGTYRCGYENERDITACIGILRKRGAPLHLQAINEAAEAEMEWIVIKSYLSDNVCEAHAVISSFEIASG